MTARSDETWRQLREWTYGQPDSERLAAQVLLAEGFTDLDPSHPLGGKDGGRDATCRRDGTCWVMAAYFPRGQQRFSQIRGKFVSDLAAASANGAQGMAFVTNQELKLAQREDLRQKAGTLKVEIYHLERITTVLDQPAMASVRKQFLGIDAGGAKGPPIVYKYVSYEYVLKAGIVRKVEAEGCRPRWVSANDESKSIGCDGWEYVESVRADGARERFRLRDVPVTGGYLVLLKKRKEA